MIALTSLDIFSALPKAVATFAECMASKPGEEPKTPLLYRESEGKNLSR